MSSPPKQKENVTGTVADPDLSVGSDSDQEAIVQDLTPVASPSQKKKKKKKSKIAKVSGDNGGKDEPPQESLDPVKGDPATVELNGVNAENVGEAAEKLKISAIGVEKPSSELNKKDAGEHKFWETQPVPQLGEEPPEDDGCIVVRTLDEVRQEPFPLPKEFEWTTLDIDDPKQINELYDFLSLNYVEDDDAAFRFHYSSEFLAWALKPPGYHKELHLGVRVSSNKKLVAFISGVPVSLRIRQNLIPKVSGINYLCIHKKLRSKRLAPVLIKEVSRQCQLLGIFQAIHTASVVIPTPVSICRYHHRLLNIPKLIDTGYYYIPRDKTLARLKRMHKLPTTTSLKGLRAMEENDIVSVADLFARYMMRFEMVPIYTVEELRHQMLSGMGEGEMGSGGVGRRKGQVIWSYVVENPETGKITDFVSFYSLPSTVINNPIHPILEAACLYYYATEVGLQPGDDQEQRVKQQLTLLIGDALIIASEAKFDVFNALTLMDNVPILQDLKFQSGDGTLNYYLHNWRAANLAGMNSEGSTPAGKGVGVLLL